MAKRLWEKGEELDKQIHEFTVGDDPTVDLNLVPFDILGSAAHARMLAEVGLLTADEASKLIAALSDIRQLWKKQNFSIPRELEDCHTAIEDYLIQKLGDAGRKIHTGRSRNDQVLLCTRLYLRSSIIDSLESLVRFAEVLLERAQPLSAQIMPGYTHFQPAMPASVGMWLHAFAESTLQLIRDGFALITSLNTNPLGAASGFGVPLPLRRDLTASLLGFERVQRNPMAVQNSRGYFELKSLQWAADVSTTIEKLAWDFVLFSTREFGFVKIPDAFTTGSSIMPQKHNPDVLELLRAHAAKVRGAEDELRWVFTKLPSSYHRDLQYTKEPTIRGLKQMALSIPIMTEVVRGFTIDTARLEAAMTPDLFATYDAFRLAQSGLPFRDAYKQTAERVRNNTLDVADLRKDFDSIVASNQAEMREAATEVQAAQRETQSWKTKLKEIEAALFA